MPFNHNPPLIGIVGVCASGKSTLIQNLTLLGYRCRHIAQEHSYVQDMYHRLTNPDLLIFLEVEYPVTLMRRNLNWTVEEFQIQRSRLDHARSHADLIIDTSILSAEQVAEVAIQFIEASPLGRSS